MDANGFRVRGRCGVRVQRSHRRTLSTASDGAAPRTEREEGRGANVPVEEARTHTRSVNGLLIIFASPTTDRTHELEGSTPRPEIDTRPDLRIDLVPECRTHLSTRSRVRAPWSLR